jgi:hypothetical protein
MKVVGQSENMLMNLPDCMAPFLWGQQSTFTLQRTTVYIYTAVKTSNLTAAASLYMPTYTFSTFLNL